MATCDAIVEFLESISEVTDVLGDRESLGTTEILRPATDREARDGDVSWISKKRLRRDPNRIAECAGALLLCPAGAVPEAGEHSLVVSCHNPRNAMLCVIKEFFSDLAEDGLPSAEEDQISPTAKIGKGVTLSAGVVIGKGCTIGDGCSIGPNTVIVRSHIGENVSIAANCSIGFPGFGYERGATGRWEQFPHVGHVIIEDEVEIGSNVCIDRGTIGNTVIRCAARIDNLVHIAHNVEIGSNTLVIANSMICGSVIVGDDVWIAPSASVLNGTTIGSNATVGMGALVFHSVKPEQTVLGHPAQPAHLPKRSR